MKVPWYETSPGATAALIETGSFVDVDLYSFFPAGGLAGGSPLRYSAGALAVAIPGTSWPRTVTFDQDKAKAVGYQKVGLDTSQWQVVTAPRLVDILTGEAFPDAIAGQGWLAALQAGALDGSEVQIDRAFAAAWPPATAPSFAPVGIVTVFYGRLAEIDVGRSQAVLTINSHINKLADPLPRNLFQAPCIHTLFDIGCTLSAASFAVSGTMAAASSSNVVTSSVGAPGGSGVYALGRITMTGGASDGFSRTVRSWTAPSGGNPGSFTLISPFPFGVAGGDPFLAYPGCDKQYNTCGRFQNQVNFGGQIAIPAPETAV